MKIHLDHYDFTSKLNFLYLLKYTSILCKRAVRGSTQLRLEVSRIIYYVGQRKTALCVNSKTCNFMIEMNRLSAGVRLYRRRVNAGSLAHHITASYLLNKHAIKYVTYLQNVSRVRVRCVSINLKIV